MRVRNFLSSARRVKNDISYDLMVLGVPDDQIKQISTDFGMLINKVNIISKKYL